MRVTKDSALMRTLSPMLSLTRPVRNRLGLRLCQWEYLGRYLSVRWRYLARRPISTRGELPLLLNFLKLEGKGVEVGVRAGEYSEAILEESHLSLLYSVDPWKEFGKEEYIDISNVPQLEQDRLYEATVKRMGRFGSRSTILRMTSQEASERFKDGKLDFVYIDAQHSYEACKEDLHLWWPKIKIGGIFAGHDYLNGRLSNGLYGVKRAVDEFAQEQDLKVFVTKEEWPTWYVGKK